MLFHVSLPNSLILGVEVDPKANGQECLDKICEQLDIIEVDYFGLMYKGSKSENLWLNLRNRIDDQLSGPPPHQLQIKVKFFVKPHYILQESTRHLFYLQVKQELHNHVLTVEDENKALNMIALIAQAEFGDQNHNFYQLNKYKDVFKGLCEFTADNVHKVFECHTGLCGTTAANAEYKLLQEASELDNYGMETHIARNGNYEEIEIGVGPTGFFVHNLAHHTTQMVAYPLIQMATYMDKSVVLKIYDTDGEPKNTMGFRLVSKKAANALYRSVTEMHSFFRCDTVRNDVSTQFSRDLKGTLASLFNENTDLGKKYVFDIRRTCREAYDHARRKLHTNSQMASTNNTVEERSPLQVHTVNNELQLNTHTKLEEIEMLKSKLQCIEEGFTCLVCRDNSIQTALCPCGHVICCQSCAEQLTECPMCRSQIDKIQRVFIPGIQGTDSQRIDIACAVTSSET
ncbi:hypothetical protein LOTGIDRAFT_206409 [Lottia gigantea]|uniref:RING-type E3 ubiquitin transferase n=1 Tax=Lottia gigantea TaxID=225164 RepID=V3ZUC7_LOTGI|nr:hypothetical protein LOTGIDRAFT_206409 [Lottia gigantea]ESO95088.1 hypothetical protein LOTGIDRAFT_206409 [Lottia gigantea]